MMKLLLLTLVSIASSLLVNADSYSAPQTASGSSGPYPAAVTTTSSGPYAPAGWRPSGRQFILPAAAPQQTQPKPTYIPPAPPAPDSSYGVPYTQPASYDSTTSRQEIEELTTEPPQTIPPKAEPESENLEQPTDSGTYYILLPDGRLQKVTYATMPLKETMEHLQEQQDAENQVKPGGFVANIKYQDVRPIMGPIYAYNPAPLTRIYK